jgi:subtilase family serine protease
VVYFASSGDRGSVNIYPSVSPFVVSAGGTSVNRDRNGTFVSETGWSGNGGGSRKYESKPTHQSGIPGTDATQRSAPDFSFDADPNTAFLCMTARRARVDVTGIEPVNPSNLNEKAP